MDKATQPLTHGHGSPPLGRDVRTVVAIVVCGAITTVLDATIVSVAIDRLGSQFGGPVSQVQWVMTAYLLALSAVIPLTGWAADRYGGNRVWMVSLCSFAAGSLLCGLAWSLESLIVFRVLQGLGGGMVAPVGMTLVAQAAGPQRMGRAMSMVGIPMMLGPVIGPVLGGVLISAVSWRWIFLLNLPIAALAIAWSARLAARATPESRLLPTTAVISGAASVASLATSAATHASLTIPRDRDDETMIKLARRMFIAGGPVHGVAYGIFTAVLAATARRTGLFGRATATTGLVSAATGILSLLYFRWENAGWLIPIGRFSGYILAGIAGVRLAGSRRSRPA